MQSDPKSQQVKADLGGSMHVSEESKSKDAEVREKMEHMLKNKTKEVQCGRTVCGEGRK